MAINHHSVPHNRFLGHASRQLYASEFDLIYAPSNDQLACFSALLLKCKDAGISTTYLKYIPKTVMKMSSAITRLSKILVNAQIPLDDPAIENYFASMVTVPKASITPSTASNNQDEKTISVVKQPNFEIVNRQQTQNLQKQEDKMNAKKNTTQLKLPESAMDNDPPSKKYGMPFQILKTQPVAKKSTLRMILTTPELASTLLGFNTLNRRVREQVVKRYAQDMKDGNWKPSQDSPISFDENNELKNGQHRLRSIIAAGKSEYLWYLMEPMTVEEAYYIDQGASRNTRDIMHINYKHAEYTDKIGSIIKGSYVGGESLTDAQIETLYLRHMTLLEDIEYLSNELPRKLGAVPVKCALFLSAVPREMGGSVPLAVLESFVSIVKNNVVPVNAGNGGYTALCWSQWLMGQSSSTRDRAFRALVINHTQNAIYNFNKSIYLKRCVKSAELRYPQLTLKD